MPLVSIIIPYFSAERFVARAVESALTQTHAPVEVIVVDDGSQGDGLTRALAQHTGQVQLIRQANAGVSAARNAGFAQSHGDYVTFLDSDDWLEPEYVAAHLGVLRFRPEIGISHTGWALVDAKGSTRIGEQRPTHSADLLRALLLRETHIPGCVAMLRREVFERAGGWDVTLRAAEDNDLFIRAGLHGVRFAAIPEPLYVYRVLGESSSHRIEHIRRYEFQRLETLFARHDLPEHVRALHDPAYASLHFEYAVRNYVNDDMARGAAELREAIRLWPARAEDRDWLMNWLGGALSHPEITQPRAVLDRMFAHLPDSAHTLRGLKREIIGSIHIVAAFAARDRGDRDAVRANVWPAIRHRPAILKNRGFVKMVLDAG
jgi:glycosyltransferase involved in cell wall biosynthesis